MQACDSYHIHTELAYLAYAETDGSWKITVHHHNFYKVMTPIAPAVPDDISLLEKINVSPVSWNAAIDLAKFFFPLSMSIGLPEAVCL